MDQPQLPSFSSLSSSLRKRTAVFPESEFEYPFKIPAAVLTPDATTQETMGTSSDQDSAMNSFDLDTSSEVNNNNPTDVGVGIGAGCFEPSRGRELVYLNKDGRIITTKLLTPDQYQLLARKVQYLKVGGEMTVIRMKPPITGCTAPNNGNAAADGIPVMLPINIDSKRMKIGTCIEKIILPASGRNPMSSTATSFDAGRIGLEKDLALAYNTNPLPGYSIPTPNYEKVQQLVPEVAPNQDYTNRINRYSYPSYPPDIPAPSYPNFPNQNRVADLPDALVLAAGYQFPESTSRPHQELDMINMIPANIGDENCDYIYNTINSYFNGQIAIPDDPIPPNPAFQATWNYFTNSKKN